MLISEQLIILNYNEKKRKIPLAGNFGAPQMFTRMKQAVIMDLVLQNRFELYKIENSNKIVMKILDKSATGNLVLDLALEAIGKWYRKEINGLSNRIYYKNLFDIMALKGILSYEQKGKKKKNFILEDLSLKSDLEEKIRACVFENTPPDENLAVLIAMSVSWIGPINFKLAMKYQERINEIKTHESLRKQVQKSLAAVFWT